MISVIIATYGSEVWSELAHARALPSAVQQAEDVIIGHDSDASIAQVRNALARKAEGDLLCFLDADDELAAGYIPAMQAAWDKQQRPDLLLTPCVQRVSKGRKRVPRFYAEVNLLSSNWLIIGTVLSRDLFERVGGFCDYPHGFEDWSLWYKCARLGAEVVKVKKAIYVQHINEDSKHRQGWRDGDYQLRTHTRVLAELEAWTP